MKLRSGIRILFLVASTPFLVVGYLNIEKAAEKHGYDQFLNNFIDLIAKQFQEPIKDSGAAMSSPIPEFIFSPVMQFASAAILAFVAGLWLDVLLRWFERGPLNWIRHLWRRFRGQKVPPPPETGTFSHDQQSRVKATPIVHAELDVPQLSKANPRLAIRFAIFNGNPNMTDITGFTGGIRVLGEELFQDMALKIDSNTRNASEFFWLTLQNGLTPQMADLIQRSVQQHQTLAVNFIDARFHFRMRVPGHPSGVPYAIKVPDRISFDCRKRGKAQPDLLVSQRLLWPGPNHPQGEETGTQLPQGIGEETQPKTPRD